MIPRNIEYNDYFKGYLELLELLSCVEKEKITYDNFKQFIDNLHENHLIIVIENNNKIIGTGTLLIENKIIHNMGKVGHIEDIVVNKNFRGKGIGKIIINYLNNISFNNNCYKTILDCSENNIIFYEKCGFNKKEIQMAKYF